jgi:hypothetical protein
MTRTASALAALLMITSVGFVQDASKDALKKNPFYI